MGVPAFYGWLVRTFGSSFVLEEFGKSKNVYVDMNSVIHPCCHSDHGNLHGTEEAMFQAVCAELEKLVLMTEPQELLFLAIDGVAPSAKMTQQRERRLRAVTEEDERRMVEDRVRRNKELLGEPMPPKRIVPLPSDSAWDKNNITPGTQFMLDLSAHLQAFVARRLSSGDAHWKNLNVIISDAQVPGEGEHKILEFIRAQGPAPYLEDTAPQSQAARKGAQRGAGKRPGANSEGKKLRSRDFEHLIIGDDADLTMLGLGLHRPGVAVLRNVSRLEKMLKTNIARATKVPPPFLADLAHPEKHAYGRNKRVVEEGNEQRRKKLNEHVAANERVATRRVEYAAIDMDGLRAELRSKLNSAGMPEAVFSRVLNDLLVVFVLGGNDFLPHLPTLDVRNNALGVLLDVYSKAVLAREGGRKYIVREDHSIDLEVLEHFMADFCSVEEHICQDARPAGPDIGPSDADLALTFERRLRIERGRRWRPPRSMEVCTLRRDPKTQLCSHGNRCVRLHGNFVPRDYSLHRIRSAVLAFALQTSERYLEGDRRFEPLQPFGNATFAFPDGPQRGELVRDGKHEGQLALKLTGLDSVERNNVRAMAFCIGMHVGFVSGPGKESGKESDKGTDPLVLSLVEKHAVWHENGVPLKLRAWAVRMRQLLDATYADEVDHANDEYVGALTSQAVASDMTSMSGSSSSSGKDQGFSPHLYYLEKLNVDASNPDGKAEIQAMARDYVRGMQFVARYYLERLPSWTWQYTHHYAPFGRDLLSALPELRAAGDVDAWGASQPATPVQQLLSVLPARSSAAVPASSRALMLSKDSPVAEFYPDPDDVQLDPNGRRFRWQWVAILPSLDQARLAHAVDGTREKWTPEERLRDEQGKPLLITSGPQQDQEQLGAVEPEQSAAAAAASSASKECLLSGPDLPFRAEVLSSRAVGKVVFADLALGLPSQAMQRRALCSVAPTWLGAPQRLTLRSRHVAFAQRALRGMRFMR